MKVVSVNVGLPREVQWRGRTVRTSIWKDPVDGPVRVATLNLEGDRQSDLSVHGGVHKAVYAYPSEHYPLWRAELPGVELGWGNFGENLTTQGLAEPDVHVGDRFRIGTAEFMVTQPRMPCYKLGIRFGRPQMEKQFLRSGRSGFYLAVLREGQLTAGDAIERVSIGEGKISVQTVARLYTDHTDDHELLRVLAELAALPPGWREHFQKRLSTPRESDASPAGESPS